MIQKKEIDHQGEYHRCLVGIQDAMYVLNGKWKLLILDALRTGPRRFKELQRIVGDITPKLLSKELKELELNELVVRRVYASHPVLIEYDLTDYGSSLDNVLQTLGEWGLNHRARIHANGKKEPDLTHEQG